MNPMKNRDTFAGIRRLTAVALIGAMTLAGLALADAAEKQPGDKPEEAFPPLFPFVISYDGPDNASSMAHLLDAPAGSHGFVRVEDGRFVTDKGRIRFHATNLTGPANFPTHEQSDKLAARLARFGINCVRMHYFDVAYGNFMTAAEPGIFGKGKYPPPLGAEFNFDPEMVDRQDYLIAALKKRGIYVNMNLLVARNGKNAIYFFDPLAIASQKDFARALLARVNPYTGLAYSDDPCVAMVEIQNESSIFLGYRGFDRLNEQQAAELRRQWNEWLVKAYGNTEALRQAWQWEITPLGEEQVPEGNFDGGITFDDKRWILEKGTAGVTAEAADGVLKVEVTKDGDEMFPKIFRRVSLKQGQPYTVSFRVRRVGGEGPLPLGFGVAKTQGGWKSLGVGAQYQVESDWQTFTRSFYAEETTDLAEIQFTRFKKGTYEIDDLSFQSGATNAFIDAAQTARLEDGSVPLVKINEFVPLQARRDFYRFLNDTEHAYWTEIDTYLKHDLKVKAPVSGTQLGWSLPWLQAELDYVDAHSYWGHPSPVSKDWRTRNEPMVNSLDCILGLATMRVQGKPYTVSEYNHPFPNQYGAEGQPMLSAYGALQGWDGVFQYTYNHTPDFEPRNLTYFFSSIARTDVLAHFPACAAMYLRGDVREAQESFVGSLDYAERLDGLVRTQLLFSINLDRRYALVHKVAMAFPGEGAEESVRTPNPSTSVRGNVIVSDTGELAWNRERPGKAYWTVDTPDTKLFSGFPDGREVALGEVRLAVGKTRLGWATVSLTSRNATGFGGDGRSANILLAVTGLSENKGMVISKVSESKITLTDWGQGETQVEGIPAVVTLPSDAAKTACFALDPEGKRKASVPVEKAAGGSRIVIGPQYETVWYEIAVSDAR